MPEALHIQAMELYKQYLIVGGMPAVVAEFVDTKSLLTSTEIQGRILNEYIADMAKICFPGHKCENKGMLQFNPNTIG